MILERHEIPDRGRNGDGCQQRHYRAAHLLQGIGEDLARRGRELTAVVAEQINQLVGGAGPVQDAVAHHGDPLGSVGRG